MVEASHGNVHLNRAKLKHKKILGTKSKSDCSYQRVLCLACCRNDQLEQGVITTLTEMPPTVVVVTDSGEQTPLLHQNSSPPADSTATSQSQSSNEQDPNSAASSLLAYFVVSQSPYVLYSLLSLQYLPKTRFASISIIF